MGGDYRGNNNRTVQIGGDIRPRVGEAQPPLQPLPVVKGPHPPQRTLRRRLEVDEQRAEPRAEVGLALAYPLLQEDAPGAGPAEVGVLHALGAVSVV